VMGRHGTLPHEQELAQPFELDITIETHLALAARTDDLQSTIDYSRVIDSVVGVVETKHFSLIETLASAVADAVLGYEGVEAVTVEVRKLRPPVAAEVGSVGVRLRRTRA
jgi:dihydroneopterin aldolase